ncbi:hypothetical protein DMI60_23645 [Escherichia coli]|nr:hypothetical protein [Escherichia coli]
MRCIAGVNVSNAAFPHDSSLTIALLLVMMASLASVNPYSGGAQPVRVNHYLNAHHAEISSFFI